MINVEYHRRGKVEQEEMPNVDCRVWHLKPGVRD